MTAYIKLSTLEYPRHVGDIALDNAGMADYAAVEWIDPPAIDVATQRAYEGKPAQDGGVWKMTWIVRNATAEEIEQAKNPVDPMKRFLV